MLYYDEKLPSPGTIVVANIGTEEENNEHCIYVTLPEYNDYRGIIYKCELPKRVKMHKKAVLSMKRAKKIVCIVTNTPKFTSNGNPELIELTVKGIDLKHQQSIITRYKNIKNIIKLIKFVLQTMPQKTNYSDVIETFHKNIIIPLKTIDETDGVDDYTLLYTNYLRNCDEFVKMFNIDESDHASVIVELKKRINEKNASSTLCFDLLVLKGSSHHNTQTTVSNNDKTNDDKTNDNKTNDDKTNDDKTNDDKTNDDKNDAIHIIHDVFNQVKTDHINNNVDIRYIGAPTYEIYLPSVKVEIIDDVYQTIKDTIVNFMKEKGVDSYDLKFDTNGKNVKHGEISISFPKLVETI
jgi:translation initiation factor 2 alpha subunit (eIF-2alpha)